MYCSIESSSSVLLEGSAAFSGHATSVAIASFGRTAHSNGPASLARGTIVCKHVRIAVDERRRFMLGRCANFSTFFAVGRFFRLSENRLCKSNFWLLRGLFAIGRYARMKAQSSVGGCVGLTASSSPNAWRPRAPAPKLSRPRVWLVGSNDRFDSSNQESAVRSSTGSLAWTFGSAECHASASLAGRPHAASLPTRRSQHQEIQFVIGCRITATHRPMKFRWRLRSTRLVLIMATCEPARTTFFSRSAADWIAASSPPGSRSFRRRQL